ncbi:deoxyribonuclease IV [Holzapfeliella sp. He02]|uniref:Probable endonuclease 4 n=1 Tax=Holzapfeliella saturejae TaxID=3082953 RepID=A0ABU8SGJ1_9LACO
MSKESLIIGSHVKLSGKKMLLLSTEETIANQANTMMVFTGAPQNTRRRPLSDFNIEQATPIIEDHKINPIVVHAPYIINLGNVKKPENFGFAVNFLAEEMQRAEAIGARYISFHPGSHVGSGEEAAIAQIIKGLDEAIEKSETQTVSIALETMAGKGTEIGKKFEELAQIIAGSSHPDRLSITFDTCHVYDAGYDIKNDFEGVMAEFDRVVGLDRITVIHLNDSKFGLDSHKDRHENLGFGQLGFETLQKVAYYEPFKALPKILETPFIPDESDSKKKYSPYKREIEMLRQKQFDNYLKEEVLKENQ